MQNNFHSVLRSLLIRVLPLVWLVISSYSYSQVTILKLPNGITYEFDTEELETKGFSSLKQTTQPKQAGSQEKHIAIEPMGKSIQGFIELTSGPIYDKHAGTLHIIALIPEDSQTLKEHSLSLAYLGSEQSTSTSQHAYTDITNAMESLQITEWQHGKLGMSASATSIADAHLTLDNQSIKINAPKHRVVMAFSIANITADTIAFQQPQMVLDQRSFTFNNPQKLELRPETDVVLIMHLVGDDKSSRIAIHTTRGEGSTSTEAAYTLDTAERWKLVRLAPMEAFVALAREVGLQEADIASVISNPALVNPSDKSYHLLELLGDRSAEGSSSTFIAEKLTVAGYPQLAQRVQNKQLDITVDDQELQQQMVKLGKLLDSHAEDLALHAGLSEDDRKAVKDQNQHGYILLDRAGRVSKLHDVHNAITASKLVIIETELDNPELGLLALQMRTPPKNQGNGTQSPSYQPAKLIIPDDDTLTLRLFLQYDDSDLHFDMETYLKDRKMTALTQLFNYHKVEAHPSLLASQNSGRNYILTDVANLFYGLWRKGFDDSEEPYLKSSILSPNYGMMVSWLNHPQLPIDLRSMGKGILLKAIKGKQKLGKRERENVATQFRKHASSIVPTTSWETPLDHLLPIKASHESQKP